MAMIIKKCKKCWIEHENCECFFEYTNFRYDLIEQKCLRHNENYQEKFHEKLKEIPFNTNKFSNKDNNMFIFLKF